MTVSGTLVKAMYFSALLIAGAVLGWSQVTPDPSGAVIWPWWVGLAAFVVAIVTQRNPQGAALTGSICAVLEGTVLGAVSAI